MNELFSAFTLNAGDTLTATSVMLAFIFSAIGGVAIGITYHLSNSESNIQRNFVLTLFMLPVIMSMIILFVGSNVARAFSLAGTVSIIRFRSAPGDPKDIGYIFFSVAAGLACGIGYYVYGLIFVLILCAVMVLLEKSGFGTGKAHTRMLKITIPESLNYTDAFSDVFDQYTKKVSLYGVKTADLGSVFVLTYHIVMNEDANEKEMIDALRCKNGNLTVALSEIPVVSK